MAASLDNFIGSALGMHSPQEYARAVAAFQSINNIKRQNRISDKLEDRQDVTWAREDVQYAREQDQLAREDAYRNIDEIGSPTDTLGIVLPGAHGAPASAPASTPAATPAATLGLPKHTPAPVPAASTTATKINPPSTTLGSIVGNAPSLGILNQPPMENIPIQPIQGYEGQAILNHGTVSGGSPTPESASMLASGSVPDAPPKNVPPSSLMGSGRFVYRAQARGPYNVSPNLVKDPKKSLADTAPIIVTPSMDKPRGKAQTSVAHPDVDPDIQTLLENPPSIGQEMQNLLNQREQLVTVGNETVTMFDKEIANVQTIIDSVRDGTTDTVEAGVRIAEDSARNAREVANMRIGEINRQIEANNAKIEAYKRQAKAANFAGDTTARDHYRDLIAEVTKESEELRDRGVEIAESVMGLVSTAKRARADVGLGKSSAVAGQAKTLQDLFKVSTDIQEKRSIYIAGLVSNTQIIDAKIPVLEAAKALQDLEINSTARAGAVLSKILGSNVEVVLRYDGNYNLVIDGEVRAVHTYAQIVDRVRSATSEAYRQAKQDAAIEAAKPKDPKATSVPEGSKLFYKDETGSEFIIDPNHASRSPDGSVVETPLVTQLGIPGGTY